MLTIPSSHANQSVTSQNKKKHRVKGKYSKFRGNHSHHRPSIYKNSVQRRASDGMTAAIILIAFIITSAGIAFVILTLGSEMNVELGNVGEEGKDSASSVMQIEGNVITGYVNSSKYLEAIAFNCKLILGSGQIDLSDDAIEIWVSLDHAESVSFAEDSITSLSNAASKSQKYDIQWINADSNSIITSGEMARFYIGFANEGLAAGSQLLIVLYSSTATLKIEKTIPNGLVAGTNFI